ncbi:MAG: oxidase [Terracidiphilus sp.]|nr:oxidase [Terracidiphilus sp.]
MSGQTEQHRVTSSPVVYLGVYISLLAGVGLTILVSKLNLGIGNPVAALAIAFTQITLVVLFSMHVRKGSKLVKLAIGSSLFTLGILYTMVLIDYSSRAWGSW